MDLPDLELIRVCGQGGMATVWKARDLTLDKIVAVKILNKEFASSPADLKRFQAEERALEMIRHPNIVEGYRLCCHEGVWYYVMEFVDGYNYGQYLSRHAHVREEDCLLICESVAYALDYAWNNYGLVHCDMKPENLMINRNGEIKITDLGLCHIYVGDGKPISDMDHILGTPAYISPEQAYNDVELDLRTDIYSLAASLYHLSSGEALYSRYDIVDTIKAQCSDTLQSNDPRLNNPNLSEGFVQLLEAMLVKNRDERVQNWADVLEMCRYIERGGAFKKRESAAISALKLVGLAGVGPATPTLKVSCSTN